MGSSYMGFDQISKSDFEELDFLFQKFMNGREIWLFGTGQYAAAFFLFLKEGGGEYGNIEGFVVSDTEENPKTFMGKKVVSRKEFYQYYMENSDKRIGLLLTINARYLGEVYPHLMYLRDDLYIPRQFYLQCACDRWGGTS